LPKIKNFSTRLSRFKFLFRFSALLRAISPQQEKKGAWFYVNTTVPGFNPQGNFISGVQF
jgi:hypothetical protein